jgi:hypothetical protein
MTFGLGHSFDIWIWTFLIQKTMSNDPTPSTNHFFPTLGYGHLTLILQKIYRQNIPHLKFIKKR